MQPSPEAAAAGMPGFVGTEAAAVAARMSVALGKEVVAAVGTLQAGIGLRMSASTRSATPTAQVSQLRGVSR